MVVGEASIHNIMGGMESTGGVRLHNHKRKLTHRFDIIKKLGQGNYGKVQLGINKETGQEVAIKTIKKCKIETEADLVRIRREIQIMSSVQHPNIIHIYEVFENKEKMVLVMEYAAGGELYDYLRERKVLTEHEARRIFRQIATAVFYCHKHKICHRDLKLENILLDQLGNAKIADFGLSNVFDEQRLLNTFCGSPLYASPEIVKGTPYHGPEVDCWSLGVLLYTLVYGAMPFDGSNFKRLVEQISQSDYFEPKKPSRASPLIKDILTVCPARRADIERICTHWWVNEGYEENCLDIAEDLAAQTPVRLDLLLSLVPQSASAEKLVVGDQRPTGDVANSVSSETLVPTRCHSVGSLMELDRDNSDRRIRELLEEEPRAAPSGDAKRKLETTPSMDETAAAGVKRKERSRKKDRTDDREARTYKSASRHHSAPIPSAITEEAMEIDPAVVTPDADRIVEPSKIETTAAAAACLELIEECKERSPSKERSDTPLAAESSPRERREDAETAPQEEERRTLDESCGEKPLGRGAIEEGALPAFETPGTGDRPGDDATVESPPEDVPEAKTPSEAAANRGQETTGPVSADSSREKMDADATRRESRKSRDKALSLDSDGGSEARDVPAKTFERRRSKIFETAEKFNQMSSSVESEKPRKIFIPGVNVGGAKRVFERKASLSSTSAPPPVKSSASKVIIDVPTCKKSDERQTEKAEKAEKTEKPASNREILDAEERGRREEAKKRAVDVIAGAIGKPPVQRRVNGSPPTSPPSQESGKLPLKIPLAPNDARTATVSVSTPVETKFPFPEGGSTDREATVSVGRPTPRPGVAAAEPARSGSGSGPSQPEEPKMSTSKMEITLKSATLPRPRRTSKAEISISGTGMGTAEPAAAFKSEVEAKIDAFQPQKLRTQRSEIAFPVAAAVPQAGRSSSLEPEGRPRTAAPKERIIPIRVEGEARPGQLRSSTPPAKPPMPQRSVSQRSGSLSRQSTADSDTDSALGSTVGPEPIRKSPREYIIPIAVEGGGYVTPRSGSVEPESKTSTPTGANPPRSRFGRPRRMSSLLSDASEDESPFSALHRDSEDLLQRHMHRLRSSRPSRQPPEHADSLSSGEDDDDDGFELLTAENLFSTLLSRVRSLTQRLNVDDDRGTGFPSTRLFGRLGTNPSQPFWGVNQPLSRRLTESQFRHSFGREGDVFSRKDSAADSSNPGSPSSPGSHGAAAPSRESVFDVGSNTLPRGNGGSSKTKIESSAMPADRIEREDVEADSKRVGKETRDKLEQNFTPCLARRLSRTFGERAVGRASSSTSSSASSRSCSGPQDEHRRYSANERDSLETGDRVPSSVSSSAPSNRSAVPELEPGPELEAALPRGGEYRPTARVNGIEEASSSRTIVPGRGFSRAGSLRATRGPDKIQEETADETSDSWQDCADNGSVSEATSCSLANSTGNLGNPASSLSASVRSCETSPTESSSNALDRGTCAYGMDSSRNFENRLLAAENLIKESKLRNLGPTRLDRNLASSYGDIDKCDKESLLAVSRAGGLSKRRSCIPGLRPRSGSPSGDRRRSLVIPRASSPDRSILSKLFGPAGFASGRDPRPRSVRPERIERTEHTEPNGKARQHRISRFLRPDFFDTPREESKYAKEKEARKAAENERRKSRFMKRRAESKENRSTADVPDVLPDVPNLPNGRKKADGMDSPAKDHAGDEKPMARDSERSEESIEPIESDRDRRKQPAKPESRGSRGNFLRSLERKLEKLRTGEEATKPATAVARNGRIVPEGRETREKSAPPTADERRSTTARRSIERATSAESVPAGKTPRCAVGKNGKSGKNARNGRVSSVLGLFRSFDSRQTAPGPKARPSPTSEPSKSPPKSATTISSEESSSLGKQPAKTLKGDARPYVTAVSTPGKRLREGKKSTEKSSDEREGKSVTGRAPREKRSTAGEKTADTAETEERIEPSSESAERSTKETAATDAFGKKKTTRVVKKMAKKSSDGSDCKSRGKRKPDPGTEKLAKSSPSVEAEIEAEVGATDLPDRPGLTRPSRAALKLDLSKIPQHAFRAAASGKSSPKSDSPSGPPAESARSFKTDNAGPSDSLVDRLSRMTHRATIAGNKIVIDKPLRAKDVAELKREVSECARLIENRAVAPEEPMESTEPMEPMEPMEPIEPIERKEEPPEEPVPRGRRIEDRPIEIPEEPARTPEGSLDSWSLGSVDRSEGFGPSRRELPSPTSPSSPSSPSRSFQPRSDDSESIVDRIRRRSFYSRFNDRRRPSLTAPPPGLTLPTSTTLPRKFSFGYRDRDRDRDRDRERDRERDRSCAGKYHPGYSVSKPRLSEEIFSRERSTDRLSSSYEPLGRYLRSPTFDSSASRSRYSCADFASSEPDSGSSYRKSLSGLLADGLLEARPAIGSATLPRKYGSTAEPKTIEYYEGLLAPSGSDYSPVGRTPLSADYLPRYENGYHNGGLETRGHLPRRRSYADRVPSLELLDASDGELLERRRGRSERASETRNVPSSIVEPPTACPAERATDPI